jgi:SulP family sulfate permease
MVARRTPKLITALKNYSAHDFVSDVIAGLTVGLVALPLAMAFGISSESHRRLVSIRQLSPGSDFCAWRVEGADRRANGRFCRDRFGNRGEVRTIRLAIATVMAGIMLLVMGLTGLGSAVKFIPRPVVIGFTNGIAVLIASTQIKDFLGLQIDAVPSEFVPRMRSSSRISTQRTGLRWLCLQVRLPAFSCGRG